MYACTVARITRIYLARHGQTETNREGRFCGHAETSLTPLGIEQARALAGRLARVELAAAYTSDFSRAIQTAMLILGERGVAPRPEPALRELHYGEWELERESVIRRRDPERYRLMRDEDPAWRPPGGESVAEVRERTSRALDRIVKAHRGREVLVVSHGTAINCMLSAVLGMPESHVFRIDVANCALTELEERNGRLYVVRLNDTAHLAGLS